MNADNVCIGEQLIDILGIAAIWQLLDPTIPKPIIVGELVIADYLLDMARHLLSKLSTDAASPNHSHCLVLKEQTLKSLRREVCLLRVFAVPPEVL